MRDMQLNDHHARNPQIGDCWFERIFCGVCVVVAVSTDVVFYCIKRMDSGPDHWTWDFRELRVKSREQFYKMLKYDTIDSFWCDVRPKMWKFN